MRLPVPSLRSLSHHRVIEIPFSAGQSIERAVLLRQLLLRHCLCLERREARPSAVSDGSATGGCDCGATGRQSVCYTRALASTASNILTAGWYQRRTNRGGRGGGGRRPENFSRNDSRKVRPQLQYCRVDALTSVLRLGQYHLLNFLLRPRHHCLTALRRSWQTIECRVSPGGSCHSLPIHADVYHPLWICSGTIQDQMPKILRRPLHKLSLSECPQLIYRAATGYTTNTKMIRIVRLWAYDHQLN